MNCRLHEERVSVDYGRRTRHIDMREVKFVNTKNRIVERANDKTVAGILNAKLTYTRDDNPDFKLVSWSVFEGFTEAGLYEGLYNVLIEHTSYQTVQIKHHVTEGGAGFMCIMKKK